MTVGAAVGVAVGTTVGVTGMGVAVAAGASVAVGAAVAVGTGVGVGNGVGVGTAVGFGVHVAVGFNVCVGIAVSVGVGSAAVGVGVGTGADAVLFERDNPPISNPAETIRTEHPKNSCFSHFAFGSQSRDTISAAAPKTQMIPPSILPIPFFRHFLHCINSKLLLQSHLAFSYGFHYTLFVNIPIARRSNTMRSASEYRRIARQRLSGNWGIAIAASLIAGLLGAGGSSIPIPSFDFSSVSETSPLSEYLPHFSQEGGAAIPVLSGVLIILLVFLAIVTVVGIALAVIGSAMDLGRRKFFVRLIHGETPDFGALFHYFRHLGKAFVLRLLINIFIFLWSLLFVIPGIVAAYRYAMAPYLMAKDPTLSPMAAIRMSKEIMRGKKMDLFILSLSFIGWSILCLFTCGIGYLFLSPYMHAAEAAFALDCLGLGSSIDEEPSEAPNAPPSDINTIFDE